MLAYCRRGFTLIELSIVLVIIGLVVGGILVGRDLIHAAEIRTVVRQVEVLNTAVNTFRLKYNCLPGDCANADQFGFTPFTLLQPPPPTANGSGNGHIDTNNLYPFAYEYLQAIFSLGEAQLIQTLLIDSNNGGEPGCSDTCPIPYIPSPLQINDGNGPAGWIPIFLESFAVPIVASVHASGHYLWFTNWLGYALLLPADAYAIDAKIDDGLPRSGKVLAAMGDASIDPGPAYDDSLPGYAVSPDEAACILFDGSVRQYNIRNYSRNSTNYCNLTAKAAF